MVPIIRERLREFADQFLEYVNNPGDDPAGRLAMFLAPDVETPLTYPGAVAGYAGIQGILEKLHNSLSNYSMELITPVVDEKDRTVVYFIKSKGVQTGYYFDKMTE